MSYLGTQPDLYASPDLTSATYTGDGSTTVYTLPTSVDNDASAIISIDGVRQHTSAYSTSSTTLTFTAPPPNGSAIEVVILGIENALQTVSDNSIGINKLDVSDGSNGQALMTNGAGVLNFGDVDAFPSQTNNSGQFLTTNGTIVSWNTVDALPSQTTHSGKYLTTDGTNASWDFDNLTAHPLYEHSNTITSNYSISTGNNALTAGPITINAGVSVTVPTGSTWVIA
jgi:hypothetical protein